MKKVTPNEILRELYPDNHIYRDKAQSVITSIFEGVEASTNLEYDVILFNLFVVKYNDKLEDRYNRREERIKEFENVSTPEEYREVTHKYRVRVNNERKEAKARVRNTLTNCRAVIKEDYSKHRKIMVRFNIDRKDIIKAANILLVLIFKPVTNEY